MNKYVIVGIIIVVLAGGAWYMKSSKTSADVQPVVNEMPVNPSVPVTEMVVESKTNAKKSFIVEGSSFKFSPSEINVKQGDTVEIVFNNMEGFHDWVVDEFNAKTKQIKAGESETITFVADKTGTFEYYCSVGKHRANGMVGKLIVE